MLGINGQQLAAEESDEDITQDLTTQYEVIRLLGEGGYGQVFLGRRLANDEHVAIKKVPLQDGHEEGLPTATIREVSFLKQLIHRNIIQLYDILVEETTMNLVFERLDCDLRDYLVKEGALGELGRLQDAMLQCCQGVAFIHSSRMMHRDLKPANILIRLTDFLLKIADFGMARFYTFPLKNHSHRVMTLWYRPPEIMLGASKYSPSADVWSLGCIFGEMALGRPLFMGDSEFGTLVRIFMLLGTPKQDVWPEALELRDWMPSFPKFRSTELDPIRRAAPVLGDHGVDLMGRLLVLQPTRRAAVREVADQHPFFEGAR